MDNKNNQLPKRQDRSGSNNPMWQRHHTQETKNKMSQAAIKRSQEYQKLKDAKPLTMDEFLRNNPSLEKYIKLLTKAVIKEEIDRFVRQKQPPLQIPII